MVTIHPRINREEAGIVVEIRGGSTTALYELRREYRWWPDDPVAVEERVLRKSRLRGSAAPLGVINDATPPYDLELTYKLYVTTNQVDFTLVATSAPIVMEWWNPSDDPFDWHNDRPILRDPFNIDPYDPRHPSTTRPYQHVVVTEYTADWPVRGEVRVSVIGSQYPRMVTDQRELKQGRFSVLTAPYRRLNPNAQPPYTDADWLPVSAAYQRTNLLNLLSTTRILHLRGWCVDGMKDLFLVATNIRETIPFINHPDVRLWEIEFQQVRDPATYWTKRWRFNTSYTLLRTFKSTYNLVRSDFPNYDDLATRDLMPPTSPLTAATASPFEAARL